MSSSDVEQASLITGLFSAECAETIQAVASSVEFAGQLTVRVCDPAVDEQRQTYVAAVLSRQAEKGTPVDSDGHCPSPDTEESIQRNLNRAASDGQVGLVISSYAARGLGSFWRKVDASSSVVAN